MAEESILTDDFLRELINVGEVDILIGVPTYNDAASVGKVVEAVREGLLRYFPRQRAVIINADGGSRDGTQDLVRAASISDVQRGLKLNTLRTLHCISTQYPGQANGGTALHTILAALDLSRATTCVVVSPESTSLEPEWIERLIRPMVRDGFDLVAPIYRRHKFDGLLLRNLVYPMTRALYGRRLREPYPIDFAVSQRMGCELLTQDIWWQDAGRTGAETALSIAAITGDYRVAQSFLGTRARVDSGGDLVRAMRQTVGVLFWSLEQNFAIWSAIKDSQPIPTIGAEHEVSLDPLRLNRKRVHQMFVHGVAELEPVLKSILCPPTLAELQAAAAVPEEQFRYSDELWVRTAYEFAAAYHHAAISRDHVVQALAPLYRGKAYTFLVENRDSSADEVEKNVESLCLTFERLKPYLLEQWEGRK